MKKINDPESPLCRWLKTDIREGISNLRSSQITAETEERYPIYFSDLAPWWQKAALEHVVPHLLSNSVLMLGKAGDGKTPSNIILGFAMSHYHGDRLGMENFAGQSGPGVISFTSGSNLESSSAPTSSTTVTSTSRTRRR